MIHPDDTAQKASSTPQIYAPQNTQSHIDRTADKIIDHFSPHELFLSVLIIALGFVIYKLAMYVYKFQTDTINYHRERIGEVVKTMTNSLDTMEQTLDDVKLQNIKFIEYLLEVRELMRDMSKKS